MRIFSGRSCKLFVRTCCSVTPLAQQSSVFSHDWPDRDALNILKRLKEAASPETRLVVIEHTIQSLAKQEHRSPPLTLQAPPIPYHLDLQMMSAVNAQERTVEHFQKLFEETGWKLERIGRGAPEAPHHFICKVAA